MEVVMAAWKLSSEQWDALDDLRFSTTDARLFRWVTIILMTAVGRSKNSIAHDLGCSPATVDQIRQRYRRKGLAGLRVGKPSGRPSAVTAEYRAALRLAVQTPPPKLGYGFSVWSAARLGAHLQRQTGLAFSHAHVRRLLREEGFSFQRPKHTMKGKRDEAAYAQASQAFETLKKKPWPTTPTKC